MDTRRSSRAAQLGQQHAQASVKPAAHPRCVRSSTGGHHRRAERRRPPRASRPPRPASSSHERLTRVYYRVVAGTLRTSCDLVMFVNQAAESIALNISDRVRGFGYPHATIDSAVESDVR